MPAGADPLPFVQRVFETIGFGKVSTSGPDARASATCAPVDAITMNRERLLADAKARRAGARAGLRAAAAPDRDPGRRDVVFAALKLGVHLAWRAGRISDHDALIGRKLAWILAGGNARSDHGDRAATARSRARSFLSLCGERKTQERIAHTLKTGKTLRN